MPSDPLVSSFAASYPGVLAFMAGAAERSFVKAGLRLGLSRSAVSRSVQKLEEHLQTRLLRRTTRSVSLTAEGEVFHAACRPGVEQIAQALHHMRELRGSPARGPLRVCATVGFGRKVVAPLLAGFHQAHPGVEVELVLDDRMTDFIVDRIDVTFRNGRLEDSGIVARQLAPMQMLLCASKAYAAKHGLPRSLDELQQHPCIQFRLGSGRLYEWEFEVLDDSAGTAMQRVRKFMPTGRRVFNDPELVIDAVRQGLGIAQVAGYQALDDLRSGELVSFLDHHAPTGRAHYICYLHRQHLPARIRVFVDYYLRRVGEMQLSVPPAPSAGKASPASPASHHPQPAGSVADERATPLVTPR